MHWSLLPFIKHVILVSLSFLVLHALRGSLVGPIIHVQLAFLA